jgi:tetratricopeptide (TPR) repeat protein
MPLGLALTLREMRRFHEAEAVYNQILSRHSFHPRPLMGKGHLAATGNRRAALNYFEVASQAGPANVRISMTLVDELRDQGQFERARLILETVLKNDPKIPFELDPPWSARAAYGTKRESTGGLRDNIQT